MGNEPRVCCWPSAAWPARSWRRITRRHRFTRRWKLLSLTFYATSDQDTTLAVLTPDGSWLCDDDSHGVNPAVSLSPPQPAGLADFMALVAAPGEAFGTLGVSVDYLPPVP